jgi:Acetyltransferases
LGEKHSPRKVQDHLEKVIDSKKEAILIIRDDSTLIGFVEYVLPIADTNKAKLRFIYILPEFRNKGLARPIIKLLVDSLPKQVKSINLQVSITNKHAIRVYKHLGWKETRTDQKRLDMEYICD